MGKNSTAAQNPPPADNAVIKTALLNDLTLPMDSLTKSMGDFLDLVCERVQKAVDGAHPALERELARVYAQIKDLERANASLAASSTERQARIAELESEKARLEEDVASTSEELLTTQDKVNGLTTDLEKAQKDMNDAREEVQTHKNTVDGLLKELENVKLQSAEFRRLIQEKRKTHKFVPK